MPSGTRAEGAIAACGAAAVAGLTRSALLVPAFAGLRRSQMCFRFTKTSGRGVPPDPRTTSARHVNRHGDVPVRRRARKGRGAPGQDRRSDCARGPSGHRRPLGHRGRAHTRFRGSIIHREDVEFLCRRSETGGTPTPPGVEFVRYRRFCGLGFRATGPQTARIAVRAVFGLEHGSGSSGATRSARDSPSRILTASPVATEFPARGSGEDRIGRIVAHEGETPGGGGDGDGVRRVEHPAARRSCGGPETGTPHH